MPPLKSDAITLSREDRLATIHFCDGGLGNRLTPETVAALTEIFHEVGTDPAIHAVLFLGTPKIFCSGGSLELLKGLADGSYDERKLLHLCEAIVGCEVPVVAGVEGHAIGGGLSLVLCCDMAVGCAESRYGVPALDMGFIPAMGATTLLPTLVGVGFASEMLFTSKNYLGAELEHRRIFNHVVDRARVEPMALDLALRLVEKPRHALALTKEVVTVPKLSLLREALLREPRINELCFREPGAANTLVEGFFG